MLSPVILLLCVSFATCDVLRTVYCKSNCNDYLTVAESDMPLCRPEHLLMKQCGTVITCDWAEAERDKLRAVANSTDVSCCYQTTIKEKGDCGPIGAQAVKIETVEQAQQPMQSSNVCADADLPWFIASFLLVIVALQAGYILWSTCYRASHQKIAQSLNDYPQRPIVVARPLIDTRLMACEA